jgi:pSer/pThr/pTyr-binding forkhead associated (FHA) protein
MFPSSLVTSTTRTGRSRTSFCLSTATVNAMQGVCVYHQTYWAATAYAFAEQRAEPKIDTGPLEQIEMEQHVTQTDDDQMSRETIAGDAVLAVEPTATAVLVVKRGPNAGSSFRLHQAVTSAGRHPGSDIFLDEVTVSRRHAEFRLERGELQLVDNHSLNGTYVNGQPIDSAVLTNGDEIQMGKFRLELLIQPATD